ncbi:MAG: hypothetical protein RR620_00115 [Clostridium sp.]
MKKSLLLILTIIILLYLSYSKLANPIKTNYLYTKPLLIESKPPTPSELSIDDSMIIQKAKDILISLSDNEDNTNVIDFSDLTSKVEIIHTKTNNSPISVVFSKGSVPYYYIDFDLNTGQLTNVTSTIDYVEDLSSPILSIDELRSASHNYFNNLPLNNLQDYIFSYESMPLFYIAYYENILINKTIIIIINPTTGKLSSFSIYDSTSKSLQ